MISRRHGPPRPSGPFGEAMAQATFSSDFRRKSAQPLAGPLAISLAASRQHFLARPVVSLMESLTDHVLNAFLHHWPRIRPDPRELQARLQRRHRVMLQRPPRAWCIALRAGDTRMTAWNTILDDCHAIDHKRPHQVTIDKPLVERLCKEVCIHPLGESWIDVAARLGVHHTSLRRQMTNGFFTVRRILHYGGSRGRAVPVLTRSGELDPCSRSFLPPDGYWGNAWRRRGDCFPDDFTQAIDREPVIAPPPLNFRCWVWRCPGCGGRTDTIYFPLRVPWIEDYLQLTLPDGVTIDEANAAPEPLSTFACGRCHRVNHISRADGNGWNEFITTLTCGLLYGREVPKPADWHARSTVAFKVSRPRPAVRRNEVRDLLVNTDLSRAQIAEQLGVKVSAVDTLAAKLYDQHGVHSREELHERVKLMSPSLAGDSSVALTPTKRSASASILPLDVTENFGGIAV